MLRRTIGRQYSFEAAHFLPYVSDGHKCKRMHGHNYVMDVTVTGEITMPCGFLIDFWELDKIINPIVEIVDHRTLNNIPGLGNPTAEFIAEWFYHRIMQEGLPETCFLKQVRIYETPNCWADFET